MFNFIYILKKAINTDLFIWQFMSNDVFLFIIAENHLDIDAKPILDSCVNRCEFPTREEASRNSILEALR